MRITLATGTPAEFVRPSRVATGGLVLWPDIMGLRPLFVEHAQRLADQHGWCVVVPELYPGEEDLPIEQRHARAASFSDADKLADAEAAADWIGQFDQINVLGFCMGGMYAMKSLASPRFKRAVAFYGMVRVPEQWKGGGQGDALDVVRARRERGDLELLALFGTEDPWCPLDQIAELEAAGAQVVRYEGADHGWAQDPSRDNYREADATDAWRRAEAFLDLQPSDFRFAVVVWDEGAYDIEFGATLGRVVDSGIWVDVDTSCSGYVWFYELRDGGWHGVDANTEVVAALRRNGENWESDWTVIHGPGGPWIVTVYGPMADRRWGEYPTEQDAIDATRNFPPELDRTIHFQPDPRISTRPAHVEVTPIDQIAVTQEALDTRWNDDTATSPESRAPDA